MSFGTKNGEPDPGPEHYRDPTEPGVGTSCELRRLGVQQVPPCGEACKQQDQGPRDEERRPARDHAHAHQPQLLEARHL